MEKPMRTIIFTAAVLALAPTPALAQEQAATTTTTTTSSATQPAVPAEQPSADEANAAVTPPPPVTTIVPGAASGAGAVVTTYPGNLGPPPASALNKHYPVCTRKLQDECQNPGEGGAPGHSRALPYWPGKPASER
jgi:hypothetical protein